MEDCYRIIALISAVFVVCYLFLLIRNSRNDKWRKVIFAGFCIICIVGVIVHWRILIEVGLEGGDRSKYTVALMSIVSTFEMFVGGTKMFDNGIQEVLFGAKEMQEAHFGELIVLTSVYIAAMITTAYLIFMFLARHLYSRIWLRTHKNNIKPDPKNTYVLFGVNAYVRHLITDIRKKADNADALILVVDYLKEDEKDIDVSVFERIQTYVFRKEETVEGATIVLKAKRNLAYANPKELCESLGLKHLRPYLDCSKNIYLLLDNQDENIAALNNLLEAGVTCDMIYCHARNDELNKEIEEAYYREKPYDSESKIPGVVFVDSSLLSIRSLIRPAEDKDTLSLPVNYVKIASEGGQNLGYVESGFKAMIMGFGETGQEALSFLYEYGAFVGKNKKKAPFECHVYDSRMDKLQGEYGVSHPGMNSEEAGVYYHTMEIGAADFRDSFEKEIQDTNYIVVCCGTDKVNLKVLKFMTEHLGHKDTSDRFCIWVRMYNPNSIVYTTLESMNKRENNCIHQFGLINEIWREDVITDEAIKEDAEWFHANYLNAKYGDNIPKEQEWDYVEGIIHKADSSRKERLNAVRTQAQNFANYLHATTKYKLMDGPLLQNDALSVAQCIPGEYEGALFKGDARTKKILEYLAIGEHLRWEASHVVLGYRRGETTDPELKIHKYIKDYTRLEPQVQLFDWVVVRTTLEWYALKNDKRI